MAIPFGENHKSFREISSDYQGNKPKTQVILMRLFLIGIIMGICDLIPGVSGGTIAYITGIYQDFLLAIQSLTLSLKKIHWKFLLTLGLGVATSVLLFSKMLYFFLTFYPLLLFAFFFGVILASSSSQFIRPFRWAPFSCGFLFSFTLSGLSTFIHITPTPLWLFFSGLCATAAMLLPGISGSFMLHLLGVYALFIQALASLDLKFLIIIGVGIATGFVLFSRLIGRLLNHHPQTMHFFLVGCMLGGLRSLWPYTAQNILSASLLIILGFSATFILEKKGKVALLPSRS